MALASFKVWPVRTDGARAETVPFAHVELLERRFCAFMCAGARALDSNPGLTCGACLLQPFRTSEVDVVQAADPNRNLRVVLPVANRWRRRAAWALPGAPCIGEAPLYDHTEEHVRAAAVLVHVCASVMTVALAKLRGAKGREEEHKWVAMAAVGAPNGGLSERRQGRLP